MAATAMKHMASNFTMLDKFEGMDFRKWQKNVHFLLSSMSVVYVLTTSILEEGENATVEQIRRRNKWDNDDNVCRDLKHTLKHQKEELTLVELGSHLRIEESLRVQDNDKPKGSNVTSPSVVDMMEHNNSFMYNDNKAFMLSSNLNDSILWHTRLGHVYYKKMQDMSKDGLIPAFDMDTKKWERDIECIFVGYVEHSKAFRFYVIKPNESVLINSIIESRDAIFDKNTFSSVYRRSQMSLINETKDIGALVVPKEVDEE
nr:zinc finger, CCHC-type [Tanacetum cinerariifolium]